MKEQRNEPDHTRLEYICMYILPKVSSVMSLCGVCMTPKANSLRTDCNICLRGIRVVTPNDMNGPNGSLAIT